MLWRAARSLASTREPASMKTVIEVLLSDPGQLAWQVKEFW
jgi:hypothetical protein